MKIGKIVVQNVPKKLRKIPTGLYSVDDALDGGLDSRTAIEIYGFEGSAKSTLAYYLAGAYARRLKQGSTVDLIDLEGFNPEYAANGLEHSGFEGTLWVAPIANEKTGLMLTSAKTMQKGIEEFGEDTTTALILDSVGAIVPAAEIEGEIGDAFVGQRAKLMAMFMRNVVMLLRTKKNSSVTFIINHIHPNIGSRGFSTVGGSTPRYLCPTRIRLSVVEKYDGEELRVQGKFEKLRYRLRQQEKRLFEIITVPSYGVHPGLTAVNDCVIYGLAKREGQIRMGGKSYGFWKRMLQHYEDTEMFQPFINALAERGHEDIYQKPETVEEVSRRGRHSKNGNGRQADLSDQDDGNEVDVIRKKTRPHTVRFPSLARGNRKRREKALA